MSQLVRISHARLDASPLGPEFAAKVRARALSEDADYVTVGREVLEGLILGKRIRGLGDLIEFIARFCGAAKLAKWLEKRVGLKCGCERRRDALNRRFPFKRR